MPTPAAPHKEDIKAMIRKKEKGMTCRRLSRLAGLDENAIAVSFFQPIPRAHRAVANFLGIPVNELWPQWYDKQGNRITSRSTLKHSAKRPQPHSKKTRRHLTKKSGAA